MLLRCGSYAFEVQELCFWSAAMLLELCFWSAGAMLLTFFASKMRQKQRLFTPHLLFLSFKEQRIIYKTGIITDKSEIFID
jgi:hypothetical protein